MRLLLDTHVFLWWLADDGRLGSAEREAIRDPGNDVSLSAASVWEIVIKQARIVASTGESWRARSDSNADRWSISSDRDGQRSRG